MPHRSAHRIVRLAASALCSLALATVMLAPPATRAFAETPPDDGTSTAAPAPTGESGSGGSTSTPSGDGTATGGGSSSGTTATSTGGTSGAGGGEGTTTGSGSAASGNADGTGTSGGAMPPSPPEGSVTTSNSTQQESGGATSSSSGTSGASAAPSTTTASTGTGTAPANSASATSGAATAIGNLSTTEIVQMVIAIVNIIMPNVDPSQFTTPLVSITQNATVSNVGNATANTGGNNAVVSVLSAIAQQAGMTTTQLAGLVSAQASTASGSSTAIGNITWSDITQLTSVIVTVNGDASYTSQLTSVNQNAQVSNQGTASANTGGNTSSVTVQTQNGAGGGSMTVTQTDSVSGPTEDVPDDGTNSHLPVMYWGPASAQSTLVWVYVHGKLCKAADTIADADFPGRFVWEVKLAPRECNVYRGAKVNFIVVNPARQTIVWDNLIRESPEIRLVTPEGVIGSAAVKTR